MDQQTAFCLLMYFFCYHVIQYGLAIKKEPVWFWYFHNEFYVSNVE